MVCGPKRVYTVGGFILENQELANWLFDYATTLLEATPALDTRGVREEEIAENAVLCALLYQNGIKNSTAATEEDFRRCQQNAMKKAD